MFKKMFRLSFKQVVMFLMVWLFLGYIGRSMMKYYDMETYRSSLKKYAWLDSNEYRYNLLILTGPGSYLYTIFYIAAQDNPQWGLVLDLKFAKPLTFEEAKKLKQQQKQQQQKKQQQKQKKQKQQQKQRKLGEFLKHKYGLIPC